MLKSWVSNSALSSLILMSGLTVTGCLVMTSRTVRISISFRMVDLLVHYIPWNARIARVTASTAGIQPRCHHADRPEDEPRAGGPRLARGDDSSCCGVKVRAADGGRRTSRRHR